LQQQSKFHFENLVKLQGYCKIAGVDEAGRGPLAGPLFVAACILPEDFQLFSVEDSKKLSEKSREELYEQIIAEKNIVYSIVSIEPSVIDKINIFQATMQGMQKAVEALPTPADFVLVDGNRSPKFSIPSQPIVKGDSLSYSIGAASILAKVARDRLMYEYDRLWPEYGFACHKGYPTEKHREVLARLGPCPIHRVSYGPVRSLIDK
jgi:ribonuclease HII